MKLRQHGPVCLVGTQIHANTLRHRARSHIHVVKFETQHPAEVQELMALVETDDTASISNGVSRPKKTSCVSHHCHWASQIQDCSACARCVVCSKSPVNEIWFGLFGTSRT